MKTSKLLQVASIFRKYGFNDPDIFAEEDDLFIKGPSPDVVSNDDYETLKDIKVFAHMPETWLAVD